MGGLSALILIEMLKEGVWAGIGLGPEEMKATAASRPQNHPAELSEGQCLWFSKEKSVLFPNAKLYSASCKTACKIMSLRPWLVIVIALDIAIPLFGRIKRRKT